VHDNSWHLYLELLEETVWIKVHKPQANVILSDNGGVIEIVLSPKVIDAIALIHALKRFPHQQAEVGEDE
jgi:hypothetical protein